jgi:hypothetical protein
MMAVMVCGFGLYDVTCYDFLLWRTRNGHRQFAGKRRKKNPGKRQKMP